MDDASFEFAELEATGNSLRLGGTVIVAEQALPLKLVYRIDCAADWRVRRLDLDQTWGGETSRLRLARDPAGTWRRDGAPAPALAGCDELDLGYSPSTNSLPVNRLALPLGGEAEITAAWVRFPGLTVEPAVQRYRRIGERRYRYDSLASGFTAEMEVDALGLPTDYQGIWRRIADWRPAEEA